MIEALVTWREVLGFITIASLVVSGAGFYAFRSLVRRRFDPEFRHSLGKHLSIEERTILYFRALKWWRPDNPYSTKLAEIRLKAPTRYVVGAHFVSWNACVVILLICLVNLPACVERLGIRDLGLGYYGPTYRSDGGFLSRVIDGFLDHVAMIIHSPYSDLFMYLVVDGSLILVAALSLRHFINRKAREGESR